MEKLTLKSKLFHDLMYMVWIIAGYYEKLLGYTVPEKASDIEAAVAEENGITKLYFKFPKISDFPAIISTDRMVDIFNYHLYFDLLPSFGVPKYKAPVLPYDVIESFIVNNIAIDEKYVTIVIVYVDNPIAYDFVHLHPYI